MADVLQGLIFDLSLKTANLVKGVNESNSILNGFKDKISNIGSLISGAFTVTAILGATKALGEFALKVGESNAAVRDLTGQSGESLKHLTSSILSTSQTFDTDFNATLQSTNALSRNLGISFQDASKIIQQSIALNDDHAAELLSTFQQFAPTIKELGIRANDLTGIVTHIADSGQNVSAVFESFTKAGKNLRDLNIQTVDDLQAIGINADDLQNKVVNGSITEFDAILKISQALQKFGTNTQEAGRVITSVFGKGGVAIGVDFYKNLSKVNFGLEETLKNADEVESANLRIAAATEKINQVSVQLFGNSSTFWTNIKATMLEIASNTLVQIGNSLIGITNFIIGLYNNSILFRGVIQAIALNFKGFYDTIKGFATLFFDVFGGAGKLIKAILTGSFKEIPTIIAEGFTNVKNDVVNSAVDVFNDFKDAFENTAYNKPIALISTTAAVEQAKEAGTKAGQTFSKTFEESDYQRKEIKAKDIKIPLAQTSTVKPLPDNFNPTITKSNQQLGYTYSLLEKVGMSFKENIQDNAVTSINMLGNTIAQNVGKGINSIKDLGNAFLTTAKQIIAASLSQAMAEAILSTADIPFPFNIAAAGVAVGAISALFASIPAFENGGVVGNSNLIRMNEAGGELAIMPTGSVIIPHDLSSRLVGNGNTNVSVSVAGIFKGQDIYLNQKEVVRRRNNTI